MTWKPRVVHVAIRPNRRVAIRVSAAARYRYAVVSADEGPTSFVTTWDLAVVQLKADTRNGREVEIVDVEICSLVQPSRRTHKVAKQLELPDL